MYLQYKNVVLVSKIAPAQRECYMQQNIKGIIPTTVADG